MEIPVDFERALYELCEAHLAAVEEERDASRYQPPLPSAHQLFTTTRERLLDVFAGVGKAGVREVADLVRARFQEAGIAVQNLDARDSADPDLHYVVSPKVAYADFADACLLIQEIERELDPDEVVVFARHDLTIEEMAAPERALMGKRLTDVGWLEKGRWYSFDRDSTAVVAAAEFLGWWNRGHGPLAVVRYADGHIAHYEQAKLAEWLERGRLEEVTAPGSFAVVVCPRPGPRARPSALAERNMAPLPAAIVAL